MKKKNKGHKQRALLQIIYLPVTWLIICHSFIYSFLVDENEETLK